MFWLAAEINLFHFSYIGRKIMKGVHEERVPDSKHLVQVGYTYWTLGYILTNRGAHKLLDGKPLSRMVPVDEYLPIMYNRHPNKDWHKYFPNRNLIVSFMLSSQVPMLILTIISILIICLCG